MYPCMIFATGPGIRRRKRHKGPGDRESKGWLKTQHLYMYNSSREQNMDARRTTCSSLSNAPSPCQPAVLVIFLHGQFWLIFYVFDLSCVCYVFVCVCLYVLCGHLLGKGWPLGSRLWCLTVSLSLSHWYPGSGVLVDCIDSWSLHPHLLFFYFFFRFYKGWCF